jgi:hypothetical protein
MLATIFCHYILTRNISTRDLEEKVISVRPFHCSNKLYNLILNVISILFVHTESLSMKNQTDSATLSERK